MIIKIKNIIILICLVILGCDESSTPADCNGVQGGSAYFDQCGCCCGGNTGLPCDLCYDECENECIYCTCEDLGPVCEGIDTDDDNICDAEDECVGEYDECCVCNGPGSIYECGCEKSA